MRLAINNGEDDDYADVTLQEAIARSTNPAELMNTPVNSDDEMDDADVANLPQNQRPLPVADNDMIFRDRYVAGGAYDYMTQRGYAQRDNIRYSDAAATARRRAQRQATRDMKDAHRQSLQQRFAAASSPPITPNHLPHPFVTAPTDVPGPEAPSTEDPDVFDLMAVMTAASRN